MFKDASAVTIKKTDEDMKALFLLDEDNYNLGAEL